MVNLGAALAERGRRTLLVDLDGQGHASYWLLGPSARQQGSFVQDWLEGRAPAEAVVRPTDWPNLELVPGNLALNRLRDRLEGARRPADARQLSGRLRPLASRYDWVLLDCPAGLNSLTVNAMYAADQLLVPVAPPEPLAVDGVRHILTTLERIASGNESRPRLLGLLIANVQAGRAAQRRQIERLRSDGLPLLETWIPASARVAAATEAHRPLLATAPNSPLAKAYRALAAELEARRIG